MDSSSEWEVASSHPQDGRADAGGAEPWLGSLHDSSSSKIAMVERENGKGFILYLEAR